MLRSILVIKLLVALCTLKVNLHELLEHESCDLRFFLELTVAVGTRAHSL